MGLDGAKKALIVFVLYALRLQQKTTHADIRVGNAINVFNRYGYFSISMRVVPRNDTDHSWIFREPTVDVFTNLAGKQKYKILFFSCQTLPRLSVVHNWCCFVQSKTEHRWRTSVPRRFPHGILRQRETIVAGLLPRLHRRTAGQTVAGVYRELVEIDFGQEFRFVGYEQAYRGSHSMIIIIWTDNFVISVENKRRIFFLLLYKTKYFLLNFRYNSRAFRGTIFTVAAKQKSSSSSCFLSVNSLTSSLFRNLFPRAMSANHIWTKTVSSNYLVKPVQHCGIVHCPARFFLVRRCSVLDNRI